MRYYNIFSVIRRACDIIFIISTISIISIIFVLAGSQELYCSFKVKDILLNPIYAALKTKESQVLP